MKKNSNITACGQERYEITAVDLPLSCPSRHNAVWNAHPRIYLPIEEKGELSCPYCGTHYILKDYGHIKSHE